MKNKHVHRFGLSGYSQKDATFRCKCGERRERSLSPTERKVVREKFKADADDTLRLHAIYHEFVKKFTSEPTADSPSKWKYVGYDLMVKAEKWAEKHPTVQVVSVDDDYHAGAELILIPHQNDKTYFGTTVIYIPQCTGENPIKFFLYPGHRIGLANALSKVCKMEMAKNRRRLFPVDSEGAKKVQKQLRWTREHEAALLATDSSKSP